MDLQMKRHNWFPTDDGLDVCSVCAQPDLPEVGIFCPGPKPATTELPLWMPIKTITLEELKVRYPMTGEKCMKCALAWSPEHQCPSQGLLDAWRDAPDGSSLHEYAPGAYSLHTPIKPVEVHTTEPPEWKIAPVPQALLDLAEMERKARQEVCGITDLMRGVSSETPEWLCSRRGESAILWHWWIERGHKGGPTCETCGTTIQAFRDEDRLCATPLDRALEDFTARRKAKRDGGDDYEPPSMLRDVPLINATGTGAALTRAMSTPLPHDPPMSARLMPWRGKE